MLQCVLLCVCLFSSFAVCWRALLWRYAAGDLRALNAWWRVTRGPRRDTHWHPLPVPLQCASRCLQRMFTDLWGATRDIVAVWPLMKGLIAHVIQCSRWELIQSGFCVNSLAIFRMYITFIIKDHSGNHRRNPTAATATRPYMKIRVFWCCDRTHKLSGSGLGPAEVPQSDF